jgi:poly(A) polymerase
MSRQKQLALDTASVLREAGHVVYLAGGAVRDQLLDQEPKDYDLATSARPGEVQALFQKSDAVGEHFGVIIVKGKGEMIEVATFRTDGSYKDGRRPESVEFSSPEDDARRRDFTINGLFQDPFSGEIIDHVGGRTDLETGILRAIGEPQERFEEDALRLLRAVRFAVMTGFEIEAKTWLAMQECAPLLAKISPERIRDEFSRILVAKDRARGLDLLVESGLMKEFLPEVLALQGCEQPPQWHPEGDVYVHTRIALSLLDSPGLNLALAVLLHDIGKPATQTWDDEAERFRFNGHDKVGAKMAEEILRRLRYSNQTVDEVSFMVSRHMKFMHVKDMRTAKLKRFMAAESFEQETELHRVDCESSNGFRDNYDFVRAKKEEFAKAPLIPKPLLSGHDVIRVFKIPHGPGIGEILRAVQTEQLEGRLFDKEGALNFVRETLLK